MRRSVNEYRAQSESRFNNYGGDFAGGMYSQAAGAEELDPNNRTITLTVANSTTASATATIFGAVNDLTDANKPAALTYTVQESSHLKLKTELLQNQYRILGMKMKVTNANQFDNVLSLYEEQAAGGGLIKRIWQPSNYRSAQNNLTTQIDAPSFELLMTANTYIQFTVDGSETVTFTFNIAEKREPKNVLRGRSERAVATVEAPTGLAQFDRPVGRVPKRRF